MKRLLAFILLLTLLVLTGTLVSADGQTGRNGSKFGGKARTAAMVAQLTETVLEQTEASDGIR